MQGSWHQPVQRFIWRIAVAVLVVVGASRAVEAQQPNVPAEVLHYADMVLYNGKVITADDKFSMAEAVAIRDGKFLAVGKTAQIMAMAGPQTRKIDLKGKTAMPGILQIHQDIQNYGMLMYWDRKWLRGEPEWKNPKEALAGIKRAVDRAAPGQIVFIPRVALDEPINAEIGGAAGSICKEIPLADIDAVSPNNPVFFMSIINVTTLGINSKAAELIKPFLPKGVETPFIKPGSACVHPGGSEGGILPPGAAAARDYVFFAEPDSLDQQMIAFKLIMNDLNTKGITLAKQHTAPQLMAATTEVWSRGDMTVRVRMPFPLTYFNDSGNEMMSRPPEEAETLFRRIGNFSGFGDDVLRFEGVRPPAVGGNLERGDAWTLEAKTHPYPDQKGNPSPYGNSYGEQWGEMFRGRSMVVQAVRYGWNVSADHTVGDRAVREVLNAYEEGLKDQVVKRPGQRLTINHTPMASMDDIERMAKMKVMVSMGPMHIFTPRWLEAGLAAFGTERVNKMMPVQSYIKVGMHPVLEGEGWSGYYNFVTRKDRKYKRPWNSSEAVTRQQGIWMFTKWAAEQIAEDKKIGSIETGKYADMAVLDRDPMTVPEDDLPGTRALLTLLGGKVVYEVDGALK